MQPKFLTKEERAAEALRKRAIEAEAKRKAIDEAKKKQIDFLKQVANRTTIVEPHSMSRLVFVLLLLSVYLLLSQNELKPKHCWLCQTSSCLSMQLCSNDFVFS